MKTFTLTDKEMKAARILTESCFTNMGGKRPGDLANDEFTWVSIQDLRDHGYSQHEAAGLFSSLRDKGFIQGDYSNKVGAVCETFIATEAWQYMDTIWDAKQVGADAIVKAAEEKFGKVLVLRMVRDGEYKLVIERSQPVFPDRPYMSITAGVQTGEPGFFWGHYDLLYSQAFENVFPAKEAI